MFSLFLQAALCAGLYPNVAAMEEDSIRAGHASALSRRAGLSSGQRAHWSDGRREVFIHPTSINHKVSEFRQPFIVFHEKVMIRSMAQVDFISVYVLYSPTSLQPLSIKHRLNIYVGTLPGMKKRFETCRIASGLGVSEVQRGFGLLKLQPYSCSSDLQFSMKAYKKFL